MLKVLRVVKSIATLGPLGYLKAPGTMGSIAALPAVYFFQKCIIGSYLQIFYIIVFAIAALLIIKLAVRQFQDRDPQVIIIDEFIGCFVACYSLQWASHNMIMSFILFRFFDITKLFGIHYLEKACERSWAILIDDIVAGLFANIAVRYLL